MSRVIFLLEEYSMKVLLEGLLPRLLPQLQFLCVPHEGKRDLEESIPRKLKAWREPGARFVVLRDNDGADCVDLKNRLVQLCRTGGRQRVMVRLACQELEAWYLGEPDALADVYLDESLRTLNQKATYRDSDAVSQPARALAKLVPAFQKVSGAREMGARLSTARNASASFRAFVDGVRRLGDAQGHGASPREDR